MSQNTATWEFRANDTLSPALKNIEAAMGTAKRATGDLEKKVGAAFGQMRAAVDKLPKSINNLNDELAELERQKGEAFDIGEIKRLNAEIDRTTAKMNRLDNARPFSIKNSFRDLGNQVPMLGSAMGALTNPIGLAVAGVAAVGSVMISATRVGMEYQDSLADLSAITGVSGDGLKQLGEMAQRQAAQFGGTATENIESFKNILSVLGPELAQSPEALNAMTTSVNTLAKTMGGDVMGATQALTGAMSQYGVDLSNPIRASAEMARMMNVMAAGAKAGSAEVPDIAAAVDAAGALANQAGVSFEELNGAIQVLAMKSIKGAEAGTSLRNIMLKLGEGRFIPEDTQKALAAAGVNIQTLADTTLPLQQRLAELSKVQGDAALVAKFFGSENVVAAQALLSNQDKLKEFTEAVTGTETANEMAAVKMGTFSEQMGRMKAVFGNLQIKLFEAIAPAIQWALDLIQPFVDSLSQGTGFTASLGQGFETVRSVLEPIWNIVSMIVGHFAKVIGMTVEWYAKSELVKDIFAGIGWVLGIVGDILGWVLGLIQDLFGWITDTLDTLYTGIKDLLGLRDDDTAASAGRKAGALAMANATNAANASAANSRPSTSALPPAAPQAPQAAAAQSQTATEMRGVVSGGRETRNVTLNIGSLVENLIIQAVNGGMPRAEIENIVADVLIRTANDAEMMLT